MKTIVPIDAKGNVTIPSEVLREIAVGGAALVELEVVDHSLHVRAVEAIPDEDIWAYTPEHIAQIKRALNEGEGRQLSEADIDHLIGE
jgi:hypothetical protein